MSVLQVREAFRRGERGKNIGQFFAIPQKKNKCNYDIDFFKAEINACNTCRLVLRKVNANFQP